MNHLGHYRIPAYHASLALLYLLAVLSLAAPVRAQLIAGRFEEDREDTYVRQADIKAAIVWSRGQEELYLSPRTTGRVTNFAYVVAVPSPPTVGILAHRVLPVSHTEMLFSPQVAREIVTFLQTGLFSD